MAAPQDELNWDDTRVFLATARTGSLTAAAAELRVGVATVSRRIERLESALGVSLFSRHQTGYRLTSAGQDVLPQAESLEEAIESFRAGAESQHSVRGSVRLATAENLANALIVPALPALLEKHPALSLEVLTDVSTVNLHRRDADLALRMVRPERGNVSVRRLGTLGYGLYGSPDYIGGRDLEKLVAKLPEERLIGWSERQDMLPAAQWIARLRGGGRPIVTTTSLATQVAACRAGLGLALLPHFLATPPHLVRLPIDLDIDQSIWLVVHADLSRSRRVRVVADHIAAIVDLHSGWLAGIDD